MRLPKLLSVLSIGLLIPAFAHVEKVSKASKEEAAAKLPAIIQALPNGALKNHLNGVRASKSPIAAYNAVRVANDVKTKAASLIHYTVPAMSVLQRLPDAYPVDGKANGQLRILAARDEYEPGSFLLYSFADYDKVELKTSKLRTKDGKVFPARNLDLTVIKVWYQNGNGWYSYFADVGLKLTPELLLHDENLITVDTQKKRNFARIDYPTGSKHMWISCPFFMDDGAFNFTTAPFADAKTIQPISLKAGAFKQIFLTAHVEKDCPAGLYQGKIDLVSSGRTIGTVPVAIRVLPFTLGKPKTYFDHKRDFAVTLMGGTAMRHFTKKLGGDVARARKLRIAILKNQRKHNILHSEIGSDPSEIEDMRKAGMSTDPLFGPPRIPWVGKHYGGRLTYDELMYGKIYAKKASAFYKKHVGHNNILMTYADEPAANYMAMIRYMFHEYLNYDFLVGTAGHDQIYNKAGYIFRNTPFGDFPDTNERATKTNKIGKSYSGFYAGQHNGVENPEFVRRQHGMLSYLTNCSMINNYEFGLGTWNDLSKTLYKPMNLAYPTSDGVVDTLAWEGFREGIDDIRYVSKLMELADAAANSKNLKLKIRGLQVKQYFTLLDPLTMDLRSLRKEMIQMILTLQEAAK